MSDYGSIMYSLFPNDFIADMLVGNEHFFMGISSIHEGFDRITARYHDENAPKDAHTCFKYRSDVFEAGSRHMVK